MKKVLLVDPIFNSGNIPPNLGLGRIEAQLMQYPIDVCLVDFVISNKKNISLAAFHEMEAEFVQQVVDAARDADAIYITGSHGMELKPYAIFSRIKLVSTAIKTAYPKTKIFFGGALANYYSLVYKIDAAILNAFGIDYVVAGQEINAAKDIIKYLEIDETRTLVSGNQNLIPLWNAWQLTKYPAYLSAMINTGCPYQCTFCFEGKVYDLKNPQMLPNTVLNVIQSVRKRHKVDSIMIEDSIALSYPWFDELMDVMQMSQATWAIYARSNEIVNKKHLLSKLRKSGCRSLIVGIESFEDVDLKATKKKVTVQQTFTALDLCKQANLAIQGCMILAFPEDNLTQIENRVKCAQALQLATYRWHVLQPDWQKLPDNIMGMETSRITDHFNVQVSIPDSCLLEYLDQAPPMAFYDEHVLMRLIPYYKDIPNLDKYGYKGKFTFRELMELVVPIIQNIDLPTNEDDMYPLLFDLGPQAALSA